MARRQGPSLLSIVSVEPLAKRRFDYTGDQIFVQAIHGGHVLVSNVKAAYIPVLYDPTLVDALGQRNKAMLHAPSYHKLTWSARVLLRKVNDGGMFHPQRACQRRICLYHYIILLAEIRYLPPCVEGMDFDLINRWDDLRLRSEQFLEVFGPEVADSARSDLTIRDRVFYGTP